MSIWMLDNLMCHICHCRHAKCELFCVNLNTIYLTDNQVSAYKPQFCRD